MSKDEDVNEDEDEIDVKVKKGFRVSELREKDKKSFEKRSLTMLHTVTNSLRTASNTYVYRHFADA